VRRERKADEHAYGRVLYAHKPCQEIKRRCLRRMPTFSIFISWLKYSLIETMLPFASYQRDLPCRCSAFRFLNAELQSSRIYRIMKLCCHCQGGNSEFAKDVLVEGLQSSFGDRLSAIKSFHAHVSRYKYYNTAMSQPHPLLLPLYNQRHYCNFFSGVPFFS